MRRLFQGFADALPPDAASLTIVEDPRPGEGLTISLIPSSPTAAQISVRVDNASEVTLSFGKGSIYEVPTRGRRYTDSPFLEINHVIESRVEDQEGIRLCDFNTISDDSSSNTVRVGTGIPTTITMKVTRFEISIEETDDVVEIETKRAVFV